MEITNPQDHIDSGECDASEENEIDGIYSNDVIREQIYLISRGVRPMSLIGSVKAEHQEMKNLYQKLSGLAPINGGSSEIVPIPFVVDCGKGRAVGGFATHTWIPETYQWLNQAEVPSKHISRIIGLLLGYSTGAIAAYEAFNSGDIFDTNE